MGLANAGFALTSMERLYAMFLEVKEEAISRYFLKAYYGVVDVQLCEESDMKLSDQRGDHILFIYGEICRT